MISEEDIKEVVEKHIKCEYLKVEDTSNGCGNNFEVVIVSEEFKGKTTLARHRWVNEVLKEQIAQMHAFTQKTYTPAQWGKEQEKLNAPESETQGS